MKKGGKNKHESKRLFDREINRHRRVAITREKRAATSRDCFNVFVCKPIFIVECDSRHLSTSRRRAAAAAALRDLRDPAPRELVLEARCFSTRPPFTSPHRRTALEMHRIIACISALTDRT